MDPIAFLESIPTPVSHVVFGAGGGLLYLLRQKVKAYRVRPVEFFARPIFGGVSAFVITELLQLPNHFTSLFVGYFGIDVWDAVAARFDGKLPFAGKHEAKAESKAEPKSDEDGGKGPPPDLPM